MKNSVHRKNQQDSQLFLTILHISIITTIMVVYIHSNNVEMYNVKQDSFLYWFEDFTGFIFKMAVPFFFISSAFFLYRTAKSVCYVVKSRCKSLLLPYLLYNTLYMVFDICVCILKNGKWGDVLLSVFNGVFFYKYNYSYWFVYQLIILNVLYIFLRPLTQSKNKYIFLVLCFIAIFVSILFGDFYPWESLHLFSPWAVTYYLIGANLGIYYPIWIEKYNLLTKEVKERTMFALGILILLLYFGINVYSIISTRMYFFSNVFLIIFLFLCLDGFKGITNNNGICSMFFEGNFNFLIYSLHPMIEGVLRKIIFCTLPHNYKIAFMAYVFVPIASVASICIMCSIIFYTTPNFYNIINGFRNEKVR